MSFPASLMLGALVGTAYTAAALLGARWARTLDPSHALRVVIGGMLVRMLMVLAAVAAVLTMIAVHRGGFMLGLGMVFVLGLVAEVLFVLPRPGPDA